MSRESRRANRRRVLLTKVVRALNRDEGGHADGNRRVLVERVVFAVQLNRAAEIGSIDGGFHVLDDGKAILETDRRAFVETEQVARLIAEIATGQVAVEAVRQSKVAFVHRQRQRRRQIDQREVWFERTEGRIVVFVSGGLRRGGRGMLRSLWRHRGLLRESLRRRRNRERECERENEGVPRVWTGHGWLLSKARTIVNALIIKRLRERRVTRNVRPYASRPSRPPVPGTCLAPKRSEPL